MLILNIYCLVGELLNVELEVLMDLVINIDIENMKIESVEKS